MSRRITRLVFTAVAAMLAGLFGTEVLRAQTGTITGQVMAASTAEPLAGAQVFIEAIGLGTLSNESGEYLLTNVPAGAHQLRVSYVGYGSMAREVTVSAGETVSVDFDLTATAINLNEIVVTGTGAPTQRRQLGQTISSVDASQFETAPVTTVAQALVGRVPGLIGAGVGPSGAASRIRLRGTVSISQRNEPLIYIDGVRVDNSYESVGGIATSRLADINPDNIARVEVLKGAAAATLFGTEASSGVIQIFTKRGQVGQPVWSFRLDQQFIQMDPSRFPTNYGYDPETNEILSNRPSDDYVEVGHYQNYGLSVQGGTPGVRYFASGRIMQEDGSLPKNGVENYSLRTALDFIHSDNLTSRVDVSMIRNQVRAPYPPWGLITEFVLADPTNVSPTRPYGEQDFTVEGALDFMTTAVVDNRTISGSVEYDWLPNLRSSITAGWNNVHRIETFFIPVGAGHPARPSEGEREMVSETESSWTLDVKNYLELQLTDGLQSTLVVGAQSFWETSEGFSASVENFPSPALETLGSGSEVTGVGESFSEVINAGAFAQEQIGINNRLFLTAGVRLDGNSAFGRNFGLETYPKFGASWVVSEEPFWGFDFVDQLRLRAAYGTSGLQPGAFDAQRTWEPGRSVENNAIVTPDNRGNPDLKPERSTEREVGVEFSILDGRLGFNAVYFNQETTDALIGTRVSPSLGFTGTQLANIGALESQGLELSANWLVFQGSDFSWRVNAWYTTIDQVVMDMGGVAPFRVEGRRRWSFIREGYTPGAVIAPVHDPDNPYDVALPIEELSSLDQITPNLLQTASGQDSLVFIGNSSPTWTASLASTLDLPYGFSLRGIFTSQGGFVISNETELIRQGSGYNLAVAKMRAILDDPSSTVEQLRQVAENYGTKHFTVISDFMEDGDYVKLSELSLTYSVPESLSSRFGFGPTTITLNGRSPALWTGYSGIIDPGTGVATRSEFLQNIDYFGAPVPRRFGISIRTSR